MRHPRLLNGALALSSVLLAFVTAEAGARLVGPAAHHESASARMVDSHWRELLDCYPSNPRGYFDIDLRDEASRARYYHLAPLRYDALARRTPFAVVSRYNSLRFRDQEPGPKRHGVRRVAVVGDSFVEGQGLRETDTLPRQLERLLNAQDHRRPWEVRNCGRRGADFPALFDGFEAALTLEPDVVLYAMVLNDPVRTPEFDARQDYVNDWILDRSQQAAGQPWQAHWYRSRLAAFVNDRLDAWRIGRATTRWYLEMYGPANRAGWEKTRALIREMQRRTVARGARFVLALWPLLVGTDGSYPFTQAHEEIQRFCLEAGIEEVEILPVLRGRAPSDLWVHAIDRHPNELAQGLAAQAIAPVLARQRDVGA